MSTFNAISSAIFDVLLAPFGHEPAWFDLLAWPLVCGVVALVIYKYISNQAGIARTKDRIKVHVLAIRLFRHDPLVVLASTAKVAATNFIYIAYNLVPMVVLMVPMLVIMVQLVANYAYAPAQPGQVEVMKVVLNPDRPDLAPADVELALPPGVALDAPPVRTADREIYWRVRAEAPGDHEIAIRAGDEVVTKVWAVGGDPRKIPVKRTRSWEAFLYPGEAGLDASSPVFAVEIPYPTRDLGWLPGGEIGVLGLFLVLSLVSGYALKDLFGVTL